MSYEITHMLTVSTAHMTKQESELFVSDNPDAPLACLSWEYGCMVWIGSPGAQDLSGLSEGMQAVAKLCHQEGVQWARFDCDGPEVDGVPTYDW